MEICLVLRHKLLLYHIVLFGQEGVCKDSFGDKWGNYTNTKRVKENPHKVKGITCPEDGNGV